MRAHAFVEGVCALTEVGSQADFYAGNKDTPPSRIFGDRKKCTIPCGGVGLLPRERIAEYEVH